MKKKSQLNQKIEAVTLRTLVAGIDIAKEKQWARFVDCRGVECGKAMYFSNDRTGFEAILAKIREISKKNSFADAIVGMEPTGHYWKALANYLMKQDRVHVVLVNPYHNTSKKKKHFRKKNRGKLILDATVAPADIKYPTDIDLLNKSREHLETAVDILWKEVPHTGHKLPYSAKKARKSYLILITYKTL